jgi:transcriptional regulator with PAS, ATPase and Fis domain
MLVGKSKSIKEIRKFIEKASVSENCVLVSGETGVGKELVAREIHKRSIRQNGPFIVVDLTSIPDNLFESELFGYKKGSFTDAKEDKAGLIEEANRGTLFFDEIGDLPFHLQSKLLRVIENKELRRIGETRTRRVDVRYIFATNKDLKEEIKAKKFRKDLFFRISILDLYIPPLRERKEDIPLLIEYFLERENKERKNNKIISKEAFIKLIEYDFPGNVRELENMIKKAYDFAEEREIREEHIKFDTKLEEIILKKKEIGLPEKLFREMAERGKNYWEIVHKPFLDRELNRREVKEIIALGLKHTNGSYKKLIKLFNIGEGEKEYKKFLNILRIFKLK